METIEIIRNLCKEKGISVSGLEKIMGYGNASLSKANKIPFERIVEISEYFDVPIELFKSGSLSDIQCSPKELSEAILFYQKYQNAPPEVRSAIEILLKSLKSDA